MNYGKRKLPSMTHTVGRFEPEIGSTSEGAKDDVVKRQFRNQNEKKRRDVFNQLISQLSAIVCHPSQSNKKADKTTILEQAIKFLDNHKEAEAVLKENVSYNWKPSFLSIDEFTYLMLEALDCLTVTLDGGGVIQSVSDNTHRKLGLSLGKQELYLSDYLVEPSLIHTLLSTAKNEPERRSAVEALISSDPSSETNRRFQGVDLLCVPDSESSSNVEELPTHDLYTCIMQLKMPSWSTEYTCPPEYTFKARYSLEWKILHLDNNSVPVLGHQPFEMLGTSGYDYYHPEDIDNVSMCHKNLLQSGSCSTPLHRMYTKGQGWVWLKANLYMCYNNWNGKPEHIECLYTIPSKEAIDRFKSEGPVPQDIQNPPLPKKLRKDIPSASSNRVPQTTNRVPTPCSTDVFFTNLAESNNQMREEKFGRQKSNITPRRLTRMGISTPKPQLNPVQQKLHSQLLIKYEKLKSSLNQQQRELNRLMEQLNLVAEAAKTQPFYSPAGTGPPGALYADPRGESSTTFPHNPGP